ncbi:MAG: RelA/SpoT domain-containing protein [Defluviitaleaceae bacterium]|nr:RelA/SpoT domain-containing protein [Defluviitaleaceae bacterium]
MGLIGIEVSKMLTIKQAGKTLSQYEIYEPQAAEAVSFVQDWRKEFKQPLNTVYVALRKAVLDVDILGETASRLKRLKSIQYKLNKNPDMGLSRMHDIGGCRAVVGSVEQVYEVAKKLQRKNAKRELLKTYDYIENPKDSGYRSLHLVFSQSPRGDGSTRKIEVQIRTRLQHTWATAVELAEIATTHKLKSGEGTAEWKRFFALISSIFALQETEPIVPETPGVKHKIIKELKELEHQHKILYQLGVLLEFNDFIGELNKEKSGHHILFINTQLRKVAVMPYSKNDYDKAYKDYIRFEKNENFAYAYNVVLVSAESYRSLRSMYPNYFADISMFLDVTRLLGIE